MYGDELSSFEESMRDNPELYQEVVLMKGIKSSLERRAKNVEQIKEWHRYQIHRRHVANTHIGQRQVVLSNRLLPHLREVCVNG